MKIVKLNQTQKFQNSATCTAFEYPSDDKDINGAVITLNGRYPEKGYAMNEVCKELVYVVEGTGQLTVGDETQTLQQGDLALLLPGEKYFFEGELTMFMPCSPAWYPEQHKSLIHRSHPALDSAANFSRYAF
ncbi:MAG TPA: AraC family ligand binding domain-containing protein [Candidatus Saccharimonadales bacterium]|nr:AraC family ligand binding domain-containing protein [Candidatus Saccharimonadales bacterium]